MERLRAAAGEHVPFDPMWVRPATAREIWVRMLNNLKFLYLRQGDGLSALGCFDRILVLDPKAAPRAARPRPPARAPRLHPRRDRGPDGLPRARAAQRGFRGRPTASRCPGPPTPGPQLTLERLSTSCRTSKMAAGAPTIGTPEPSFARKDTLTVRVLDRPPCSCWSSVTKPPFDPIGRSAADEIVEDLDFMVATAQEPDHELVDPVVIDVAHRRPSDTIATSGNSTSRSSG